MIHSAEARILVRFAVLAATSAVAEEKKIKRSDLPPAVEKTVCRAKRRRPPLRFSKETLRRARPFTSRDGR